MNQILITMESLAGIIRPWTLNFSSGDLSRITQMVKADGVEFFPIRCPATQDVLDGRPSYVIEAAQQSWRSEKNLPMLLAFYRHHLTNPKLCFLATSAFAQVVERRESLKHLVSLSQRKNKIPIIVYPHHSGKIGGQEWSEKKYPQFWKIQTRIVQPEPTLVQEDRWGKMTARNFAEKAWAYGYEGFCLSRYTMKAWPRSWPRAVETLLRDTKLVRFHAGSQESIALLSYLKKLGYAGPVVIKLTPKPFWSKKEFVAHCAESVNQVRDLLN